MKKFGLFAVAALFVFAGAGASQAGEYTVDANSTKRINLNLCSPEVMVTVNGDGDTDLDFRVVDSVGRTVHEDHDRTDLMVARISKPRGCESYTLYVTNLGNVYNRFTVSITGARSASR
jgi:hypothetical protein